MYDFERTKQLYEEIDQIKKFKESPDFTRYKKELKWFDDVTSRRTGEYYQANELIRRDMVSKKWSPPHIDEQQKPLEYPLKYVTGIYRVKTSDLSEYLMTTETWYGLDVFGNALNISMDFKQRYDDIRPIYTNKVKNPKDRDSEVELQITSIKHNMKYTLIWTPENFDKLYKMKNGKCVLVLKDETQDKSPYEISKPESFRNSSFEELFEYASTPHTKLDRSYGDNLDNSHIR
jgi:hypothetical protein